MLEKFKANLIFELLLRRHDIKKAYKMVGPEDSWYDTITTVHHSLAEIKKLPHEDWEITSHDGLALKAVFYPGTTNKTMIWVHGYTSHAERESAFPGLFYHSMGFNVLIPYLRAHGPSEGKYISFGPQECRDLKGWLDKVNARIPDGQVMFHGLSMGGGIVLDLATMELENVKCVLADAPSVSIPGFFKTVTYGTFKSGQEKIITYLHQRFQKVSSADAADYDRVETIRRGKYPLFLTAGSNENMEDVLNSLKERNPHPTTVLILPGCNHGNGMYKQTHMYQTAIREFIDRYMASDA